VKGRKPVIKRLQRGSFRRWQLYLPAATVLRDEATYSTCTLNFITYVEAMSPPRGNYSLFLGEIGSIVQDWRPYSAR
jgi:hypothetical protein